VPLLTNKDVSLLTRGKLISRVSIAIGQDNTWTGDTIMKRSIFQLILAIDFMAFYFTKTYILFIVDKDFLGPRLCLWTLLGDFPRPLLCPLPPWRQIDAYGNYTQVVCIVVFYMAVKHDL